MDNLTLVLGLAQTELDTIESLVNVKLKEFNKLNAKQIKRLNAISGAGYVTDYLGCLRSIKSKIKEINNTGNSDNEN